MPAPRPSVAASARMQRQRTRDTSPEVDLRRILHRTGLRFRVHYPVPGNRRRTIDIAFTRLRIAIFVDGCFWHGCPDHGTWPRTNAQWWKSKIEANRERDSNTSEALGRLGWIVMRVWEHEPVEDAAGRILETVHQVRASMGLSESAPKISAWDEP